jgi:hypothetical protein
VPLFRLGHIDLSLGSAVCTPDLPGGGGGGGGGAEDGRPLSGGLSGAGLDLPGGGGGGGGGAEDWCPLSGGLPGAGPGVPHADPHFLLFGVLHHAEPRPNPLNKCVSPR